MAKYTRREFLERLVGVQYNDATKNKIAKWVKRGNLIEGADGLIDDTIKKNSDWAVAKMLEAKSETKIGRPSSQIKIPTPKEELSRPIRLEPTFDAKQVLENFENEQDEPSRQEFIEQRQLFHKKTMMDESFNDEDGWANLDIQYKQKAIMKIVAETEYKQLQIEKIKGLVVPLDAISLLISSLQRSYVNNVENFCKKIIYNFGVQKKMDDKEITALREKIISELNHFIVESCEIAEGIVEKMVEEYSEKRGKGERIG